MKRILEQPKIVVYENVEKVNDILASWGGLNYSLSSEDLEDVAKEILDEFNISYGKKTEIGMFENNVQATLVTNKKGIAKVVIAPTNKDCYDKEGNIINE